MLAKVESKIPTLAANWKMYKTPQETREFLQDFEKLMKSFAGSIDCLIFPNSMSVETFSQNSPQNKPGSLSQILSWGLQNFYPKLEGAFTGENSAMVAKQLGAKYLLVGHSERRIYFAESDEFISEKISFAQELDLIPLFCVGETLAERESQSTEQILESNSCRV